ncbi:MAG TPA: hypothetical protein VGR93_04205 [Candidatus Acidoferrales bacterium]|nr:hypothetical protein [Candidatus Acidoferrales bacterium]
MMYSQGFELFRLQLRQRNGTNEACGPGSGQASHLGGITSREQDELVIIAPILYLSAPPIRG